MIVPLAKPYTTSNPPASLEPLPLPPADTISVPPAEAVAPLATPPLSTVATPPFEIVI